jgi:hypothetical protein
MYTSTLLGASTCPLSLDSDLLLQQVNIYTHLSIQMHSSTMLQPPAFICTLWCIHVHSSAVLRPPSPKCTHLHSLVHPPAPFQFTVLQPPALKGAHVHSLVHPHVRHHCSLTYCCKIYTCTVSSGTSMCTPPLWSNLLLQIFTSTLSGTSMCTHTTVLQPPALKCTHLF